MPSRAEEQPIEPEALEQAAEWFAVLRADNSDEAEHRRWRAWLAARAEHRRAWARVEALETRFRRLRSAPARSALSVAGSSRRRALKGLVALAVAGPALWAGTRLAPLAEWRADYRTATGEIRAVELADGTQVWLNTASALNVRYGEAGRRLELVGGEVLVHTAPDIRRPPRALRLRTAAGEISPLGTRFSAREQTDGVTVAVYEGSVALRPARRPHAGRTLGAGEQARMHRAAVGPPRPIARGEPSWTRGVLRANDMRLGAFLEELARYRRGYLGYSPEVADLRLVGAFPLDDTDRVLAALEDSLPVRVRRVTPWWVRVERR